MLTVHILNVFEVILLFFYWFAWKEGRVRSLLEASGLTDQYDAACEEVYDLEEKVPELTRRILLLADERDWMAEYITAVDLYQLKKATMEEMGRVSQQKIDLGVKYENIQICLAKYPKYWPWNC